MHVFVVLCFQSRKLLSKKYSVGIARALVTIKFAVVNREKLGRGVRGHSQYRGVAVVVVVICSLQFVGLLQNFHFLSLSDTCLCSPACSCYC
jgi:hypothetical protein